MQLHPQQEISPEGGQGCPAHHRNRVAIHGEDLRPVLQEDGHKSDWLSLHDYLYLVHESVLILEVDVCTPSWKKKKNRNFKEGIIYLFFLTKSHFKKHSILTAFIHLCLALPLLASVFLMLYPGCPDEPL